LGSDLPAPRLELRWVNVSGDWAEAHCIYELVMPLDEYDVRRTEEQGMKGKAEMRIHIRTTKRTGSGRKPVWGVEVETPFRDGAHIRWDSAKLGNLPMFATCDGMVTQVLPNASGEPRGE
jgi:hypothetical protein